MAAIFPSSSPILDTEENHFNYIHSLAQLIINHYNYKACPLSLTQTMFDQVSQCVNEVYHEQEAASCVSGIT